MSSAFAEPAAPAAAAAAGGGYRHPGTVAAHLVFKALALSGYLFGTMFSSSFVLNFIIIVLLLAIDFWTVKNITGRILVGLRWWNKVNDDGTSAWIFEAKKNYTPHSSEDNIFWYSLYLTPIIWSVLAVLALLRFKFAYLLMVLIAISLSISNLMGYIKCARDAKRRVATDQYSDRAHTMASDYGKSLMTNAAGRMFTGFIGGGEPEAGLGGV